MQRTPDHRNQTLSKQLSSCAQEPIHIPGSIQPHGMLLIGKCPTREVIAVAGDVEGRLTDDWARQDITTLLSIPASGPFSELGLKPRVLGPVEGRTEMFLARGHLTGNLIIVELEPQVGPAAEAHDVLDLLDGAQTNFGKAASVRGLCERAAPEFQHLTGYNRVMVYRFLDDGSGEVVAEAKAPGMASYMNHRFPASDIPRQARELYVRNPIRVIPDATYEPAPIRALGDLGDIDLSEAALRSVSPVHLQYLENMGVAASASVSIIRNGKLWGLIACHHNTPRQIPIGARLACQALASSLARQIGSLDEMELTRERLIQRSVQDAISSASQSSLEMRSLLDDMSGTLRRTLRADGFAAIWGDEVFTSGIPIPREALDATLAWAREFAPLKVAHTMEAAVAAPALAPYKKDISGILYSRVEKDEPLHVIWFRSEQLQTVEWAGNPHKGVSGKSEALTPRRSFDAWSETVRGRSSPWTPGQVEAAGRIASALGNACTVITTRKLNRELLSALARNERLLEEREGVMQEAHHRIQNSLSLVSGFLRMQARTSHDTGAVDVLRDAERRVNAIGLIHRRLHQPQSAERVCLAKYLDDLVDEMMKTVDPAWTAFLELDLEPVQVTTHVAVSMGLIVNELLTNIEKYAYGGAPGPIHLQLRTDGGEAVCSVADQGRGKVADMVQGTGFGSTIISSMLQRMGGRLVETDNKPGLRSEIRVTV
ncbi:histidine kinase dimerization/phosphoacceptor domain -containing protein [Roseivivax sp. CAU 1761]